MKEVQGRNSKTILHQRTDRRKHQRFIKRLPAKIIVDTMISLGITSDISENGVFLRSTRRFIPGTLLDIEVTLADNRVSYLKGIVKRSANMSVSSSKSGMGIELIDKDDTFMALVKSMDDNSATVLTKDIMRGNSEPRQSSSIRHSPEPENIPVQEYFQEKRKYKRFRTQETEVRCKMNFPGAANIRNISMDGVKLTTDKTVQIGRECLVSLQHRSRVIKMQGKVVWSLLSESRKDISGNIIPVYSVGMQFSKVIEEEMDNLRQLIEEIAEQDDYCEQGKEYSSLSQNIRKKFETVSQ